MTPPTLRTAFEHVDGERDAFTERLLTYLRMPSISAKGIGMGEVADFLVTLLTEIGLETRAVTTPGWPVIVGKYTKDPDALTVLLYGHYDVQPPDPLDAWTSPPFEPEVRDGRVYARGAGDNKGQHFAQLLALETLLKTSGELPCNVILMLEGEEEVGSPHLAAFVKEHRDDLKADLVITSDGPVHDSGRATLMFGVRGVLSFELRARGANRDLHSGNWGGVAPNPLWTLTHLLGSMKDRDGRVTVEGFYDDVLPPTELERRAIADLPVDVDKVKKDLGLEQFDAPLDRGFYERLSLWPTLTINGLHGGYAGAGSKTVLPREAFAKCDVRLVEAQSVEDIFGKLKAHVGKHAPGVELVRQGAMEPSKTPLESPYAEPIKRAIEAAQGEAPLLVPAMGGSLPDYVFTKLLGIPAFVVPYANPDEANHAPDENLELERFIKGVKTGAAMLSHLARSFSRRADEADLTSGAATSGNDRLP